MTIINDKSKKMSHCVISSDLVFKLVFSCASSSRFAKFTHKQTNSLTNKLTLSEILIFSATIGWILTHLSDIVHQHCSTMFNYVRSTMINFVQLCLTLFNFVQLCSTLFNMFNFLQLCATLCNFVQLCAAMHKFCACYSRIF